MVLHDGCGVENERLESRAQRANGARGSLSMGLERHAQGGFRESVDAGLAFSPTGPAAGAFDASSESLVGSARRAAKVKRASRAENAPAGLSREL